MVRECWESLGEEKHSVLNWVFRETMAENVTLKPNLKGDERANHAEECEGRSDIWYMCVHVCVFFSDLTHFSKSRVKLRWSRLIPTICHIHLSWKHLKIISSAPFFSFSILSVIQLIKMEIFIYLFMHFLWCCFIISYF